MSKNSPHTCLTGEGSGGGGAVRRRGGHPRRRQRKKILLDDVPMRTAVRDTTQDTRHNTQHTTTTTQVSTQASPFLRSDLFCEDFMWAAEGAAHAGAAKRRRERRHRAYLKYARMSVAMALSEYKHHTSRGQRMDRAGEWERAVLHGQVPEHPTPQAAGTEYFSLDVEDVPAAGSCPDRLAGVRPQERVLRRTVQQIVDVPLVPSLDDPAPQMVEQLPDVLQFFDTLLPDPEHQDLA